MCVHICVPELMVTFFSDSSVTVDNGYRNLTYGRHTSFVCVFVFFILIFDFNAMLPAGLKPVLPLEKVNLFLHLVLSLHIAWLEPLPLTMRLSKHNYALIWSIQPMKNTCFFA